MKPDANSRPVDNMHGTGSRDSPILIDDGPGDTTIRPASPERRKWYEKERERLAKLGFNLDGAPITPPANESA